MNISISETYEGLLTAHRISIEDAYGIFKLADNFNFKHQDNGVSPSDFQDLLEQDFGISDYLVATIVLDGGIGNLECEAEDEQEERQILANLRAIDAILWGKHQQYKTLPLANQFTSVV